MVKKLSEKQRPRYYGHVYAYGSHKELVKAKYFTGETESLIEPLQAESFSSTILELTSEQSIDIWKKLLSSRFLISDRTDIATAIGRMGKSLFRDDELLKDLKSLSISYAIYREPIKRFISKALVEQRLVSLDEFKQTFIALENNNFATNTAENIGKILLLKGYFPTQTTKITSLFNQEFTTLLNDYSMWLPDIARLLLKRFWHSLGTSHFDLESFDIDANGNRRLFYDGFTRYNLKYEENTNKIEKIKIESNFYFILVCP